MYSDIQPSPKCEQVRPLSDFEMPVKCQPERVVRIGMERLEKLVQEAEQLNAKLRDAFGSVVSPRPSCTDQQRPPMPVASDLGQAVMRIADRLEIEFSNMRDFMNASDV